MLHTRTTALLSYFWNDLRFLCLTLSCPLCNSNTLHNILMILGKNVEQDETMCRLQVTTLAGLLGEGTYVVFLFFFFYKIFSSLQ